MTSEKKPEAMLTSLTPGYISSHMTDASEVLSHALPPGFQKSALLSSERAENAPPIPIARTPHPLSRKDAHPSRGASHRRPASATDNIATIFFFIRTLSLRLLHFESILKPAAEDFPSADHGPPSGLGRLREAPAVGF
ncbi:MAG: hypothetical protein HY548_05145 [Elusimicrobia bacterium]|nr:hypothetical protein [Elusimicrobiota bacterium]